MGGGLIECAHALKLNMCTHTLSRRRRRQRVDCAMGLHANAVLIERALIFYEAARPLRKIVVAQASPLAKAWHRGACSLRSLLCWSAAQHLPSVLIVLLAWQARPSHAAWVPPRRPQPAHPAKP